MITEQQRAILESMAAERGIGRLIGESDVELFTRLVEAPPVLPDGYYWVEAGDGPIIMWHRSRDDAWVGAGSWAEWKAEDLHVLSKRLVPPEAP